MTVSRPSITSEPLPLKNTRPWSQYRPEYIVVHFTGGLVDSPAGQLATWESYKEAGTNAHYLVGRGGIWEMVDPSLFMVAASVGASCGKKMPCKVEGWGPSSARSRLSMSHAKIVGHQNSLSVEICSAKKGCRVCDPLSPGWYFEQDTYEKAVQLVAWMCDNWSIKVDHIVMHNQVTGKLCPAMWCTSDAALAGFFQFKEDVSYVLNDIQHDAVTAGPGQGGSVRVEAGAWFYSRPMEASAVVGQADKASQLPYEMEQNGFYYTGSGWVKR